MELSASTQSLQVAAKIFTKINSLHFVEEFPDMQPISPLVLHHSLKCQSFIVPVPGTLKPLNLPHHQINLGVQRRLHQPNS